MKQHASLNRSFRLVRRADAQVVPVPETASGHGGSRTRATRAVALTARLLAVSVPMVAWAAPPGANQLPQGGNLVAGQAAWQSQGATLTVNQTSPRAVIDWQSFNLGSQASVVFNQAAGRSGATLNRVLDNQPSQILGRIQAPGQVFISNPNGVIFGSSASVDVGSLIATSMAMGASDFMAGNNTWQRNGATGAVLNAGALTAAEGGYIALLAPEVRNEGVIVARAGSVVLAAGEAIRLEFTDTRLGSVQVSAAELKTLVENRHAILAPGGYVVLAARSADALRSGVVNQAGVIDASSLVSRGGRVLLVGDDITLAAGSRTEATGATGGGSVLVGGDWQGSGDMHQATLVTMAAGASIDASATAQGDGGKVVLWSDVGRADSSTVVRGAIAARGGAQGGDGGRIETSGHQVDTAGSNVNASAAKGKGGLWLIDPTDIVIDNQTAYNYATTLESGTDVLVQTLAGAGNGDITLAVTAGELFWNNNASSTLTLSAARNIYINAPLSMYTANGHLVFEYGQGGVAAGNTSGYYINAPVTLPSGQHFATKLGSDGATVAYTVINTLGAAGDTNGTTLQGIGGNLAGHYVLGSTIDASATSGWNSGAGFAPLGDAGTLFSGTLDGLGHFITNLTINRPGATYVGLFGSVDTGAVIANVGLPGANVTGGSMVGALAGQNKGTVAGAFATGQVTATNYVTGGLVGNAIGGSITDSYSTANVASAGNYAGGLAANNGSAISNSYATGNVSGADFVGGLIGYQNANSGSSLIHSHASGTATGTAAGVGSLIGYRDNGVTVVNSSGGANLNSTATFAGWDLTGRWNQYDGYTAPLLSAFMRPVFIYAPNAMTYTGNLNIDPTLITANDPSAAAALNGTLRYAGSVTAAAGTYTSGVLLTGLYSNQMGSRIVYSPPGTLTIAPAVLTVTGGVAVSRAYDGTNAATATGATVSGVLGSDNVSLVATGTFADANVGTAKVVTAAYTLAGTAANNYQIAAQPTGLSADITPAQLTVTGSTAVGRIYDRTTNATVIGSALTGVFGSDAVTLSSANASFADANVGTAKGVTTAYTLTGAAASNYQLMGQPTGLTASITPAPLTIAGGSAASRVYNGGTAATVTGSLAGVIAGDSVALQTAAQFADANVGVGKPVTASFSLGGAGAGNYQLVGAMPSGLSADITRLASVTWVGGVSGDWFTASNWAGGAVPTLDNVSNVVIPAGSVASLGNSTPGNAPFLSSLTGAGGVQLTQASLGATGAVNLASVNLGAGSELLVGSLSTASYTQSGGRLAVAGALTVNGAFTQTGGLMRAGGAASITQASGDLAVRHLVADGVSLTASQGDLNFVNLGSVGDATLRASGRIAEAVGGSLTVLGNASLIAGGNVAVDQARNMVVGSISVQGTDVLVRQGLDDLVLGNVTAAGSLTLNAATGNIRQADATAVAVAGATSANAAQGSIYLMSATNRFVGAVSAQGSDIGITQGANPLVLGDVAAAANLALASGGAVSQTGTLTVGKRTSIDAGANNVTLARETNDFAGSVAVRSGALTLVDGVGGLSLGNVSTSGDTLVNSLGGSISQAGGVFASSAAGPARFNAWQDGVYTNVAVNTNAAVVINGRVLDTPVVASAVNRGVAAALGAVAPSVDGGTGGWTKIRRAVATPGIPSTAPVAVD